MLVYVLNTDGQPLMPTERCGKVRRLLKENEAIVIKRCPFTIKLLHEADSNTQEISLGIDAGSKTIGVSATTEDKVLYEAEVTLRNDVSTNLTARRACRRARRNRKTRYRKARFLNRTASKKEGWLAPSVKHKVDTHLTVIRKVCEMLPISKIVVETAQFDTQLLKALNQGLPVPEGTDYQKGELLGFANLREYVFFRDNYICQWCKGKSRDPVLHVHHWNYWRGDHTNKPDSVITLCSTCNDSKYHKPEAKRLWGWEPRITGSYRDATFMGIMRWNLYNELKTIYPDVHMTFGYITKNTRIEAGLPKEHCIDARCISGNPLVKSDGTLYIQRKVRCHNRQLHKMSVLKGGYRKANQAPKQVFGYQLFDKVRLPDRREGFVFGRRTSGSFDIRTATGERIKEITYRKLMLLEKRKSYLTERRMALLPIAEARGSRA